MAEQDNNYAFPDDYGADDDQSIISARGLGAFGRTVTTTASHLIKPNSDAPGAHYKMAMREVHKQLKRPTLQRSVFSMARTTPTDLVRSKLSTNEIQHRAVTRLPDELLSNIPEDENTYSLFQGFQASFPELTDDGKKHRRRVTRGRKMLEDTEASPKGPKHLSHLKKEKAAMMHEFQLLAVRKNMASSEIHEIDNKIANLHGMRRIILERLAGLEQEEAVLEHDIIEIEGRLEDAQLLVDEAEEIARNTATKDEEDLVIDTGDHDPEFMSQSVYEKLPPTPGSAPVRRAKKVHRRKSMPILHEHFEAGSAIREIRAHQDTITALDFDAPFGIGVTAALDDTVRVWDLNAGRCMGYLEGHTASVRTLQVEDNILATGSADATIKLWDLSRSSYDAHGTQFNKGSEEDEDAIAWENPDDQPIEPPEGSMDDCALFTLQAHVDEVTALHFRSDILVSGSSDKTIRHWDLEKGRCVQTLDVMWAAAQASASSSAGDSGWRPTGRSQSSSADFVGALQVFETALACGTADGMVRLWDLRSGQVHRSLVGHTGPVTCLQFDDVHLVTGSVDRSIRIWDLRTGSIYDAYAYDNPVTSMMFDTRRIVSAAGEDVVKVYDKVEGRQWDCGAGITQAEEGKTPAIVEREKAEAAAKDVYDASSEACEQLLRRQASALITLHRTLDGSVPKDRIAKKHLIDARLDDLASIAMSKFYSYRYDLVPFHWRRIYTDTLILMTYSSLLEALVQNLDSLSATILDFIVEHLDRALINAGGAGQRLGAPWIEKTMQMLEDLWHEQQGGEPPFKRRRLPADDDANPDRFPSDEPYGRMQLQKDCPRHQDWPLHRFETYMNSNDGAPLPVVFTDLMQEWPAMTDRPWNSRAYLLSRTFGGRRLVPVEIGRSYVDEGWGQELMPFRDFLDKYITSHVHRDEDGDPGEGAVGYLAQHNLFHQIPSLRNDIQVPDFCWASVPGHPTDASKNQPPADVPQLNAWFGPARTITPLHTDGYHNLLCQVVGTKYVRLYPPSATPRMRPRPPERGVDMSNTSELDVGVLEGWDPPPEHVDGEALAEMREGLRGVGYWECVLAPGETLVIPIGWWHYVRSLSVSFSVSFWWN
ncbi:hypothetical protein S7711_00833 [Stachybotrys chartarum IBT 7711]|uniref:Mitochondrial division protein 1 n=1 Tax=Stachybotrys chartarum (strain CBS 109288 / IBT 7711) TaxID=1280523 RepID=A0A084B0B8_STACB|nr:hypothetical protein S7711_00833 [Stachybotrys chartarum IBT 7711]KFA46407.1 hypothetical protein S40293_07979 [Stachybotrys chartarum IBT 40293]KFA74278.1 hypothetical protein S40288_08460 [Stachybotrys chartarum IBT 40288]